MIIKVLAENTASCDLFRSEHGLSLFIKTDGMNILFDTGRSDLFAENADKLGVLIKDVDICFISHGHYDHGGGLDTFLKLNCKANVYIRDSAFGDYYSNRPGGKKVYIGLDKALKTNNRFINSPSYLKINDNLETFSGVTGLKLVPSGNSDLFVKDKLGFSLDDFCHEQNLIITENGKTYLLCGCSHCGIVNILDRYKELKGTMPDYIIGGFHLYNHGMECDEKPEITYEVGNCLLKTGAKLYTCHCTGEGSFKRLKEALKDDIEYISTGNVIKI